MDEGGIFYVYGQYEECKDNKHVVTDNNKWLLCQTCHYGYVVIDDNGALLERPRLLNEAEMKEVITSLE